MAKRICGLALLVALFVLPCAGRAEVNIEPDCRMKNRPPGRCGWCALETLARHHRVTALYGLTRTHPWQASPEDLESAVTKAHVAYRLQERGERRTGEAAHDDHRPPTFAPRPIPTGDNP